MTYTIRNCASYSNTISVVMQEFDSNDRLITDASLCGFQGPNRIQKAVNKALKELMWDTIQGFTGGEVYVQANVSRETKGESK